VGRGGGGGGLNRPKPSMIESDTLCSALFLGALQAGALQDAGAGAAAAFELRLPCARLLPALPRQRGAPGRREGCGEQISHSSMTETRFPPTVHLAHCAVVCRLAHLRSVSATEHTFLARLLETQQQGGIVISRLNSSFVSTGGGPDAAADGRNGGTR